MDSAFIPEYVSMRHLIYSLRQGRKRWPLVAFHRKLSALGIFSTVNYKR